jgi:hypothetical protein
MYELNPWELAVGDTFYECEMGMNMKLSVKTDPTSKMIDIGDGKQRMQWSWTATDIRDQVINYCWTEGLSHYGPRLYSKPQYIHIENGNYILS